jgi:ABC-type dipeptide/oligopeptide/nickel transport system permease subunit
MEGTSSLSRLEIGQPSVRHRSQGARVFALFIKNRAAVIGVIILVCFVLIALFAGWIAPYDPLAEINPDGMAAPSRDHWMGTDRLGRDVLSRVIFGTRLSLLVGFVSVIIGTVIGTMIGIMAGFSGGWVDSVTMRVIDAMLAFPGLLLALSVVIALGTGIRNVMLAVGIGGVPQYARLTRGTTLSAKENLYVDAARVIGCSNLRIMIRHILPNVIAPIIVISTLQIGTAILAGATLSFLGLGAQPPTPEWGLMVAAGRTYLGKAWWLSTFPGLTITVVVIAINLMGDGLREALDPRLLQGE